LNTLYDAAIYTRDDLGHQKRAWDYLLAQTDPTVLAAFLTMYRDAPAVVNVPTRKPISLLSQRDNPGDYDRDGTRDAFQTCNVTSCAMVINSYTNFAVTPHQLDQLLGFSNKRYSHAELVTLMKKYGLSSTFSTTTPISVIKKHLEGGNLVIWSNRLTHGGHIVVLDKYEDGKFLVYDPYGEVFFGDKPYYKDIRKPYWLTEKRFNTYSGNGLSSAHWAHLITKDE
jgi:hypothetical protein